MAPVTLLSSMPSSTLPNGSTELAEDTADTFSPVLSVPIRLSWTRTLAVADEVSCALDGHAAQAVVRDDVA